MGRLPPGFRDGEQLPAGTSRPQYPDLDDAAGAGVPGRFLPKGSGSWIRRSVGPQVRRSAGRQLRGLERLADRQDRNPLIGLLSARRAVQAWQRIAAVVVQAHELPFLGENG